MGLENIVRYFKDFTSNTLSRGGTESIKLLWRYKILNFYIHEKSKVFGNSII